MMQKFIVYHPPNGEPHAGASSHVRLAKGELFESFGELAPAIRLAKETGFHLLVTTYFRSTLLPLARAGIEFTCLDRPDVCDMTVGAIIEVEGRQMKAPSIDPRVLKSADAAEGYRAEFEVSIYENGCYNLHQIAEDFTRREVVTPRGKTTWHTSQIQRYVRALKIDLREVREQANGY